MKEKDTYKNLIHTLKSSKPQLDEKELLINSIVQQSRHSDSAIELFDKILKILFGWTEIYWVRLSLGACSILLLFTFIGQQLIINDSTRRLEARIIKTEMKIENTGTEVEDLQEIYTQIAGEKNIKTSLNNLSQKEMKEMVCAYLHKTDAESSNTFLLKLYRNNLIEKLDCN